MKYVFNFYTDEDFYSLEELILASYEWEYPIWGLNRHEFSKGLHPAFTGHYNAWEHTVGVYRLDGKIVSCVINEGNYSGEVFFLFDSKARAQDRELLLEMIKFAKTYNSAVEESNKRVVKLFVPPWNNILKDLLTSDNFTPCDWSDNLYIMDFKGKKYTVDLPEGYSIVDGNTTPDFYLSNTHRLSFGYGGDNHACEHGKQAFHDLREMRHYKKELDLCVLDKQKRPVAMAIIWYNEKMPYCELEPLGVVWWERRKGLATALLHEAANRVMKMFPQCSGMTGGDQPFYERIGFEKKESTPVYQWEITVHPSWEKESYTEEYKNRV